MPTLDETHDRTRLSFELSATDHPDFPLQNLPLGVFSPPAAGPRGGIAIGEMILDLAALHDRGLLPTEALAASEPTLNAFLALGAAPRNLLRRRIFALLSQGSPDDRLVRECLHPASDCTLHLPVRIGDYTDFYAGIHHATEVGKLFRPDNPLLPNYKYVPIGYHGRASSVRPSDTPVRRPLGQTRPADRDEPSFGPSARLDYELELGIWVGAGNALGEPIPIGEAAERIAGFSLLNDWSARDIQAWEYQPLGPFLAKSFGSTISPWIVTPEALAPFRIPQPRRPQGDPAPLAYLLDERDQAEGALDLELEVLIRSAAMRAGHLPPHRLALTNARHIYWTVAQMLAHHASNGCNLTPGDLLGSGTISGPDMESRGSLLEATGGGREPLVLPSGEQRRFLEDGDEIVITGRARRQGFAQIGFGPCRAVILPARDPGS